MQWVGCVFWAVGQWLLSVCSLMGIASEAQLSQLSAWERCHCVLSLCLQRGFLGWQVVAFLITPPTPVLWKSSGHQFSQVPSSWVRSISRLSPPSSPCRKQSNPWRKGGAGRERRCVHSLQYGQRPVGGQGLSHGPGAIIPDCVALEAAEAEGASAMGQGRAPGSGLDPGHTGAPPWGAMPRVTEALGDLLSVRGPCYPVDGSQ